MKEIIKTGKQRYLTIIIAILILLIIPFQIYGFEVQSAQYRIVGLMSERVQTVSNNYKINFVSLGANCVRVGQQEIACQSREYTLIFDYLIQGDSPRQRCFEVNGDWLEELPFNQCCGDDVPFVTESYCSGNNQICTFKTDGTSDGLEVHFTTRCMDFWDSNNGGCWSYAPNYCIKNSEREFPINNQESVHCVSIENPSCENLNPDSCTLQGTTTIGDTTYYYNFGSMCEIKNECVGHSTQQDCPDACDWHEASQTQGQGLGDLGFISPNGLFACFKNARKPVSGGTIFDDLTNPDYSISYFPDSSFVWRFAERRPGVIMRAHDTFFVSNAERWYYCDPFDESLFGANNISELGYLPEAESVLNPLCSATLEKLTNLPFDDCEVFDGDQYLGDCPHIDNSEFGGYCPTLKDNEKRTFDAVEADFFEKCGDCQIWDYDSEKFVGIKTKLPEDHDFIEAYCAEHGNDALYCNIYGVGQTTDGFMESAFCKQYPELCLGVSFSNQDPCEVIHKSFFGNDYYYVGDNYKICDLQEEYCQGGVLLDSLEGSCCVGQSSYCAPIGDLSCSEIGGIAYSQNEICLGVSTLLAGGIDCCFGNLVPSPHLLSPSLLSGEAFICYAHNEKGFISECCGSIGCRNAGNPLNRNRELLSTAYSMTGASYHMISSFDSYEYGENVFVKSIDNKEYFSFEEEFSSGNILTSFLSAFSIENFDYLEFDFLTSRSSALKNIEIYDNAGNKVIFPFKDYIGVEDYRWQSIKIDLSSIDESKSNLNKTKISDIRFTFQPGTYFQFAVDRLFLSTQNSDKNSPNRFCSGNWGKWIENLDGPEGDRGFFIGADPSNVVDIKDYGPYKEACDATMSTAWTGHACCGDDTNKALSTDGEFWVDTRGICWNGTPILNDNTVAYALSRNYQEKSLKEKSLLFFNNEPWLCNYTRETYTEQFRFSQQAEPLTTIIRDKIPSENIAQPFTIKGKWICEAGKGWTKLSDINRVMLMASLLLKEAAMQQNENSFTLHCGNMSDVVNFDSLDSDLLGAFCLLRTGLNTDFIEANPGDTIDTPSGDVFLMFESARIEYDVLQFLNTSLMLFDSLENVEIDCSNTPENPDGEFLSPCNVIKSNSDFKGHIYHNKPLKLTLVSSIEPQQLNFLQNMWNNFVNFFQNLFGGSQENKGTSFMYLENFSDFKNSYEFYISRQGTRLIVGKTELTHPIQKIRIDYTNLTTNVSILAQNLNQKHENTVAIWTPNNYTQTIFTLANLAANQKLITFNDLSSMLRLINVQSDRINFGSEANCTLQLYDGTQENLSSGQSLIAFKKNTSQNCLNEIETLLCVNGQVLNSQLETVETQDYHESCIPLYEVIVLHQPYTENLISIPDHITVTRPGIYQFAHGDVINLELNESSSAYDYLKIINWEVDGQTIHKSGRVTKNQELRAIIGCKTNQGCASNYYCDNGLCQSVIR